MIRRRFLVLAGCTVLSLVGCAGLRADFARQSTIERELDHYFIKKPLPEVWESVTLVNGPHDTLLWNGVGWTWKDDGEWKKRTSSRTSKDHSSGDDHVEVTWFECEGRSVGGGSQVHYTQVTETTTTRNGTSLGTNKRVDRRTDLELELVRKFDPAAARRIEKKGEDAARASK